MDKSEGQTRDDQGARHFPREGFAREPEVMAFSGYKRSTVWSLSKSGRFPKPQRLPGTRITVWKREELWRWYENPAKWAQENAAVGQMAA